MAKPKGNPNGRLVPGKGTVVALNQSMLHKEAGNPVMARISYNHEKRCWEMQPFAGEGLIVFLTDVEPTAEHNRFTITNVLHTQTACYGLVS